jgi:serine/threonine kinase 32
LARYAPLPLSLLPSKPTLSPQVRVVQHKQTKDLYALKYINKAKCVKMKAVPNVIQERRLLEEVRPTHPPSFRMLTFTRGRSTTPSSSTCATPSRTMKTVSLFSISCSAAIYDVGLSFPLLFSLPTLLHLAQVHLERLGSLPEDTVRFYVAQLSSALAYLHDMGIMHRCVPLTLPPTSARSCLCSDLKPDNILLDERGNAHLTDFNIAVHFGERKLTGVAGSMAYMAPE